MEGDGQGIKAVLKKIKEFSWMNWTGVGDREEIWPR